MYPIGCGSFSQVYRVKEVLTEEDYAAKISKFIVDEDSQDSEENDTFIREVKLMSLMNHRSILKFFGYSPHNFNDDPCPTIITEFAINGSLHNIIESESSGLSPDDWNMTKKLINIYGIAIGMSYLHSQKILHRDLKSDNILLDHNFYPKICDFGLSKLTEILSKSLNAKSGIKGTPIYMAPEIISEEKYSTSSDVYAFGFIVYEIMCGEIAFNEFNIYQLIIEIQKGTRPPIKEDVPSVYREIIEKCWSQDPKERPSFNEIVEELKNNPDFITSLIDENEFIDYVQSFEKNDNPNKFKKIDNSLNNKKSFVPHKLRRCNAMWSIVPYKNNTSNLQEKLLSKLNSELNLLKINEEFEEVSDNDDENNSDDDNEKIFLYPKGEFKLLNEKCKDIVKEVQNDPNKQFILGKSLIEGENDFPRNPQLGIEYLKESISKNCLDSLFYYTLQLIKGKFILQNLNEAEQYINKFSQSEDKRIFALQGEFNKKLSNFKNSKKYFEEGAEKGEKICMYKYAKIIYLEEGMTKNYSKIINYLTQSKDLGFKKSEYFLKAINIMNSIREFSGLISETRSFFISHAVDILSEENSDVDTNDRIFKQIIIHPNETEKLFFNKSFKSSRFLACLRKFEKIFIEIRYPSTPFKSITDLISKIRKKNSMNIIIKVVFSSFPISNNSKCFSENYYYTIDDDLDEIPISSFNDCTLLKQITIPSSIISIGNYAFRGCSSLTQISIPSSVVYFGKNIFDGIVSLEITGNIKHIPDNLFNGCLSLKQISIPSSVISIGECSFAECSSLIEISIPSSVTSIGNNAFNNCSKLTHFVIPSSITSIEKYWFSGCSSLTHIIIPSSVTSIGDYSFSKCSSLTEISFPSSLTSIGNYSFNECKSLTHVIIPSSVTTIGNNSFSQCSSLAKISIPSSIKSIGDYSFSQCSSLAEISIPSSIKSIGNSLFSECFSLIHVTIPSSVTSIGDYFFVECSSLTEISIPSSITSIGNYSFYGCSSLTDIKIPSSVTSIGNSSFSQCSSLVEISIPSSIISIKSNTFSECSSLTKISIPSSITTIENNAFSQCFSLTQISIPSSVIHFGKNIFDGIVSLEITGNIKYIPDNLFNGCLSLKQISIPSSVISIENYSFNGCSSLTHITILSSVTSIGDYSFSQCSSLTEISIPSSVVSIGNNAFNNCPKLTHFVIPPFVNSIESGTFFKCSSLLRISIPSSVTSIGDFAFSGCSALTNILIPSSVVSIGDFVFSDCISLKQISIPSSVISFGSNIFDGIVSIEIIGDINHIPDNMFKGCLSLVQISIPSSVTSIGNKSFKGCKLLKDISIPPSVTFIGKQAFKGCKKIKKISIPSSVTIGDNAFSSNTIVIRK